MFNKKISFFYIYKYIFCILSLMQTSVYTKRIHKRNKIVSSCIIQYIMHIKSSFMLCCYFFIFYSKLLRIKRIKMYKKKHIGKRNCKLYHKLLSPTGIFVYSIYLFIYVRFGLHNNSRCLQFAQSLLAYCVWHRRN